MGTIADRNYMDLTEVGDIKKMWPEYTEQYEKALNDHDGVIIHLEPDILDWSQVGLRKLQNEQS